MIDVHGCTTGVHPVFVALFPKWHFYHQHYHAYLDPLQQFSKFFAAARTIAGPPTSIFSIASEKSELFDLIKAEISRNGFEDKISAGIVFTGGTSKMEGVVELAESIFQTSVRMGIPSKFKGMETILQNPIYSTSIGLIEHGYKQINHEMLAEQNQGFFSKLLRIVKSEY